MPPAEIASTFYPQLNGIKEAYAGSNHFKLHTEHLGVVVILLALCGLGGVRHRRERIALGVIAILFLLVALGGHTPFYRLWYELMPTQKSVRAVGSAFYLVALPICALAGYGAERLLAGEVSARLVWIGAATFAVLGLLGAAGALGGLAQSLADPQYVQLVVQNASAIQIGGIRLLLFAVMGGAVLLAIGGSSLRGSLAALALLVVVWADLWSVDRHFFEFGNSEELFGDDDVTATMRKTPLPYRVWDPRRPYDRLSVYPGSWLMGRDVPQLLGYHGNELRRFDELLGEKNNWANQVNRAVLELFAVRYAVFRDTVQVPGFHRLMGPVPTRTGGPGVLYEADTIPPYVRLLSGAVKVPEAQVSEVVLNPQFPALAVAVYSESTPITPGELTQVPEPAGATARLISWEPGKMRVAIEGRDERPLYLIVAENWYKDWRATVDGATAPVLRAHHTLLSVVVPPGAKEVDFDFISREYAMGRMISLIALLVALTLIIVPRLRPRPAAHG
jgi:hypothetical protein